MCEQMLHQGAGGRTNGLRPVQKAPGGPLQMALVRFGHMLGQRCMVPFTGPAPMRRDPFSFVEDLEHRAGEAHVHRLVH